MVDYGRSIQKQYFTWYYHAMVKLISTQNTIAPTYVATNYHREVTSILRTGIVMVRPVYIVTDSFGQKNLMQADKQYYCLGVDVKRSFPIQKRVSKTCFLNK